MKILELEQFINLFKDKRPDLWNLVYPRRIICPNGFFDPAYYSLGIASRKVSDLEIPSETNAVIQGVSENLLALHVPTYFIEPEFLLACENTRPPLETKFRDIKFPLDSMLIALPQGYIFNSIKWRIPFLAFSKLSKDQQITLAGKTIPIGKDTLGMQMLFIPDDGLAISYASWYPLDSDLTVLFQDEPYFDDTIKVERDLFNSVCEGLGDKYCAHNCPLPTEEQEKVLIGDLTKLMVKILLVLSAKTGIISNGSIAREAKIKRGQLSKDALWHPSFIGKGYKIAGPRESLGGSHRSPRMHFRRGHLHSVRFGKGKEFARMDWYEPILVNAPND